MSQGQSYNTVWTFKHADADSVFSTGLDFEWLSSPGLPLSETDAMEDLAAALRNNIQNNYMPILDSGFTFTGLDLYNLNEPQFGYKEGVNIVGGVAGSSVSLRSAPIVSKRTLLRGRSYRGRMFLMPATEIEQANGLLTNSYIASLQGFVDNLQIFTTATNAITFRAVVWSSKLALATPISSFIIRSHMGSLRRRQKAI